MNIIQEDIKEEIYKCSKCGLCKSVCPIFLATKNETYLARGRFIILNNFFYNKKKLNKNFINNLDFCLNCNLCKNFCPSNIDSTKIFNYFKSMYKYKSGIFPFSVKHKFIMTILKIYKYIFNFLKIKSFLLDTDLKKIYENNIKIEKKNSKTNEKVVYFEGCFNKYINSNDKNAVLNILNSLGYNTVKVISNCCGYPLLNEGNLNKFKKNAKQILDEIPYDCKYIVCSCDSCFEMLKKIDEYIPNSLTQKLIRFDELMAFHKVKINNSANNLYHKPLIRYDNCHLQEDAKTLNKKGVCTFMENFLYYKYPKKVIPLISKAFYKKEDIEDKTLITTCNITKLGLLYSLHHTNMENEVYSYAECLYNSNYK